jgi:YHS domain-containing protein
MKQVCSFFLSFLFAFALQIGISQASVFKDANGIALGGYDIVAYYQLNDAVRGNQEFKASHEDNQYFFSSADNMNLFLATPDKFLPSYGGFCAFAMAMKGAKVPTDPTTFKIRDGKLYLFFNDYYEGKPFNTIVPWNSNEKEMIQKADANWKNN